MKRWGWVDCQEGQSSKGWVSSEMEESRTRHDTSQSHKMPNRISFTTCVDNIREGLRKIRGCKDIDEEDILQPTKNPVHYKYQQELHQKSEKFTKNYNYSDKSGSISRKKSQAGTQKSNFDNFLDSIPKLDSVNRTIGWVLHSEPACGSRESLCSLPMRGTILPTRYTPGNDYPSSNDDSVTAVSSYESARGTYGRGTPPVLDSDRPHLDELFYQLQQKQERKARQQLITSGQQHLLSYNLLDVYSHQVPGLPLGTTPEIVPFMACPSCVPWPDNRNRYTGLLRTAHQPLTTVNYHCKWLHCTRQFTSAKELFSHVEQIHIHAYGAGARNRLVCKWANCNKTYFARYKLLLHVHTEHCKEFVHCSIPRISVRIFTIHAYIE